jgi:heptosyltransferase III
LLVLRPGALGDTLLAVPALRALRRRSSQLTLAAHAGAARLLEQLGEVDRGLAFDDPSLAWMFAGQAPCEPVVAWTSTPVRGALVQAPSRPNRREHCAAYLLRTLASLGCDQALDVSPLRVGALRTDEVLVHPGSGSTAKNWPPGRFAEIICALDAPVRLVVGEADTPAARRVEEALGRAVPRLQCDLPDLAARLAGCRAYLGNDSGISHLAGLCGAHSVVLFGPSDPYVWRPLGRDVHVLRFSAGVSEVLRALTAG